VLVHYGTLSPTSGVDCPPSGDYNTWCDCMWPPASSPALNSKCRDPFPGAPWTVVGAALRGIPNPSGLSLPGGGGDAGGAPGTPYAISPTTGIFGLPKMVALIGGGVLAAGLLTFILVKRKR